MHLSYLLQLKSFICVPPDNAATASTKQSIIIIRIIVITINNTNNRWTTKVFIFAVGKKDQMQKKKKCIYANYKRAVPHQLLQRKIAAERRMLPPLLRGLCSIRPRSLAAGQGRPCARRRGGRRHRRRCGRIIGGLLGLYLGDRFNLLTLVNLLFRYY